ncbi:MAG: transcription-repair coupling factor [Candidatus Euphemobacter frigidus]|nr:transcription-repair coupling factor [Candidatus Euphemobacter frigidus]MDP8274955.1 transcription-repair coupling factor [Candidatus Euphemobacter frigidus]
MEGPTALLDNSSEFRRFLTAWKSGRDVRVLGTPGSAPGFIIARAYLRSPRPFLMITREEREAERLRRELETILNMTPDVFPAPEVLPGEPDPVIRGERQAILARLAQNRDPRPFLITTPAALKKGLPLPEEYAASILEIVVGAMIDPVALVGRLVEQGYENQNPVMERGRFARRGGIVDLYPGDLDYPLRIEFEGDRVVSLRHFDPQTQRSREQLGKAEIYPLPGKGEASLFDYLPDNYRMILDGPFSPEEREEFERKRSGKSAIFFTADSGEISGPPGIAELRFSIKTLQRFKYRDAGSPHPLLSMLPEWLPAGYRVLIYAHNPGETSRLQEILTERGLYPHENLQVMTGELAHGFIWEETRLVVVGDSEIFSRYRIPRPRRKYIGTMPTLPEADFQPGDFIVHLDHGIGKFLGVKMLSVAGRKREMLVIGYADRARLYLHLTQSHLLSRYMGAGKARPKLDRLGGTRWLKAKVGAERAVRDLAADLLELQAHRAAMRGHPFDLDTAWQREFEAAFIYPETPEQSRAIIEVKRDMESERPMDRLLCGDVGYGKTEVAVRSAFKAVMGGKQAAVLVPTTVLAQQHVRTFRERMADYPVRVEPLSRLVTPKEQRKIIGDLASGAVDIVIGTHRLLQNDIIFKDLGLVVIDEEQRFGVKHKEQLKRLKKLVDVLTLTATPIPRTLYLSLTGARDLSSINTPPQDRLAVETRVSPYNLKIVKNAIRREVARNGQVFYLHNRVKDIDELRRKFETLFPDLTIAVGHGRMDEEELARVMEEFAAGRIDLLVCTTIIESGLDIPNANTIIVENAHRFGLADLYQLRGRVGRFKHRAYAYFFYPPAVYLEDAARKRLQAIEEFSHLGAGYGLALRDLEIRGAGNILGREQHGHIAAVGFDLYCRLLKESVNRIRGVEPKRPPTVTIEFDLPVTIPLDYVGTENQRVEIYRSWARISGREEIEQWLNEIRDRFGPPPPEAEALTAITKLKLTAAEKGITSIRWIAGRFVFFRDEEILLAWPGEVPDSPHALSSFARSAINETHKVRRVMSH